MTLPGEIIGGNIEIHWDQQWTLKIPLKSLVGHEWDLIDSIYLPLIDILPTLLYETGRDS